MPEINVQTLSRTPKDVDRFLQLSYTIYDRDPNWVAPLLMDLKKVFTNQNPLFQHAEMQLWIAQVDGKDAGRIAAIVDHHHNQTTGDHAAFFGFYETVQNREVSRALFEVALRWAREQGVKRVLGPMNPTTNDECGLLIEGFDSPPVLMMTYNPAYYSEFIEQEGFSKAKDLLAYMIDLSAIPLDRLGRIAEKVKKRHSEVKLRALKRKTLDADLAKIKEVYNAAWEANWGFVPMTDPEVDFMAERLKPLLMEGLIWLAEVGNEPVGFLLALPDYNIALKPLKGRLLTPHLPGFVAHLLGWKRIPRTRVITLGVKERYRSKGLESAMLIEGLKVGFAAGVRESEASWILEDNVMMCRMLEAIGGKVYKRYRIYQKSL